MATVTLECERLHIKCHVDCRCRTTEIGKCIQFYSRCSESHTHFFRWIFRNFLSAYFRLGIFLPTLKNGSNTIFVQIRVLCRRAVTFLYRNARCQSILQFLTIKNFKLLPIGCLNRESVEIVYIHYLSRREQTPQWISFAKNNCFIASCTCLFVWIRLFCVQFQIGNFLCKLFYFVCKGGILSIAFCVCFVRPSIYWQNLTVKWIHPKCKFVLCSLFETRISNVCHFDFRHFSKTTTKTHTNNFGFFFFFAISQCARVQRDGRTYTWFSQNDYNNASRAIFGHNKFSVFE